VKRSEQPHGKSDVGMNARLERKLQLLAVVIVLGAISGIVFNLAQGRPLTSAIAVGMTYGLVMSLALGVIELFILDGPLRSWLHGLSFTVNLLVRSTIYAAIIALIQWFRIGETVAGVPIQADRSKFQTRYSGPASPTPRCFRLS
jgi:adenylate cyclase